jgi:hypothetical protein
MVAVVVVGVVVMVVMVVMVVGVVVEVVVVKEGSSLYICRQASNFATRRKYGRCEKVVKGRHGLAQSMCRATNVIYYTVIK